MDKQELFSIMQSDFSLWERAETDEDESGALIKKLHLPFGIGEFNVRFEGVSNAEKRRAAMSQFGQIIRDTVDEYINDEAITAKAEQSAARVREDATKRVDGNGGDTTRATEIAGTEAMEAPNVLASGPEEVARRADDIRAEIHDLNTRLRQLRLELKGLDAYLEVINAPEDSTETTEYTGGEDA